MYLRAAALFLLLFGSFGVQAAGLDDAKMGLAALVRGNYEKAVVLTTRAIQSGTLERESLAISYYNRGRGYMKLGQPDLAKEDFRMAFEAWPEHPVTQEKARELGLLK